MVFNHFKKYFFYRFSFRHFFICLICSFLTILTFSSCSHFNRDHHPSECTHEKGGPCPHKGSMEMSCHGSSTGAQPMKCEKCGDPQKCEMQAKMMAQQKMVQAKTSLIAGKNFSVAGQIEFVASEEGVKVVGALKGLPKNKSLGIHIHEQGQCLLPDFKSAGGHFNPFNKAHGQFGAVDSHLGDLGNLTVDKDGKANMDVQIKGANLLGYHGLIGRSVVIHANADDLKSQPAGNAGDRIACGVIGLTTP